jgi:hypothetical protein
VKVKIQNLKKFPEFVETLFVSKFVSKGLKYVSLYPICNDYKIIRTQMLRRESFSDGGTNHRWGPRIFMAAL